MSEISRRTITKGAAWAVPVIVVGAPVPALAASTPGYVESLGGCKEPGKSQEDDWGYKCDLTVFAPVGSEVIFFGASAPNDPNAKIVSGKNLTTVESSQYHQVVISASNSANGTATIYYTINGVQGSVSVSITGFHPCKK